MAEIHIEQFPWQFNSTVTFRSQVTFAGGTAIELGDNDVLTFGDDNDIAMVLRSAVLNANTALTNVIVGTPVVPAQAANSLIISNVTADGDLLLAAQTGGNSQAWFWVDSSAGLGQLLGAGTRVFEWTATKIEIPDSILFTLGSDNDVALVNRATTLNANTALTGVIVGTPITPAVAANSLILGNITADGDILLAGQTGGNTHAVFFADLSAGTTSIMVAGVAVARFDSTDVLFPDDYILSIGTGASVDYKSTSTTANTAVASVILGTPVVPALAADTLIIANQIADGDLLLATQTGGNTQAAIWVDGSAGLTQIFGAGTLAASFSATAVAFSGGITSSSATAGLGYATGAGGTVTQITNRSTGVTLSKITGYIQTDTSSLAAEAAATFTVTNTTVAVGDVVVVSIRSGSNGGNTDAFVSTVAAGSFAITVANNNAAGGTAETGAILINFAVIKAVSA